jgi:hypothetical protein
VTKAWVGRALVQVWTLLQRSCFFLRERDISCWPEQPGHAAC